MTPLKDEPVKLLNCPFDIKQINRFLLKVAKSPDCWHWMGATQSRGYGQLIVNGSTMLAHRFSYTYYIGEIPKGMTIHHTCSVRNCVNPKHLKVLSQKENNLIGNSVVAINKRKTICKNGHPLVGKHIRIQKDKDGTRRRCLLCHRIYAKNARMK